jgi:hypothetical protein
LSDESGNDGVLGEAAAGSDGSATSAGEIVAIGAGDAFDDAEVAQAGELPGEGGGRALGDERPEVGAAQAYMAVRVRPFPKLPPLEQNGCGPSTLISPA